MEEDRTRSSATEKLRRAMGEGDIEIDLTVETGPLLRTGEVAVLFGVSPHSIRKWADDGKIPCIRTLGRHRLFPAREVAQVLRRISAPPEGSPGGEPAE